MKIASWPSLAVVFFCSISPQVFAAATTTAPSQTVVNKAGLADLRKAMSKAQNRFLDVYNRVNHNVDQRLTCSDSAPTGSRLARRSCSTYAQNRATEEQARSYLAAMDGINASQAQSGAIRDQASIKAQAGAPLTSEESAALSGQQAPDKDVDGSFGDAAGKVSQRAAEFEENLQKLLEKNPELRQRYEEFLAARQHYLEAGGHL